MRASTLGMATLIGAFATNIYANKPLSLEYIGEATFPTGIVQDNIEGMTFGPILPTGERSFILVSANNFSPDGQFTQFLAFKLIGYHGQ